MTSFFTVYKDLQGLYFVSTWLKYLQSKVLATWLQSRNDSKRA